MRFPKLVSGHFLQRDNHFRATVLLEGKEVKAHVRNSGALLDLFKSGRRVWLAPSFAETLRTAVNKGVEVHAYNCHVTLERIEILSKIPVQLDDQIHV